MKNMTFKKITSQRLFLPVFCLALVLLVNIVTTPNFFAIEVRNGVLYGYLIDIINRASELVILAVGMTLVVSSSAGTDISVGAIMAVSAAVCCNILTGGERAATAYANPLILGFLAALIVGAAIGTKTFASTVLGGIGVFYGGVVGGLIIGLTEVYTAAYIGSNYRNIPAFIILILVLFLRPTGLFGAKQVKKV